MVVAFATCVYHTKFAHINYYLYLCSRNQQILSSMETDYHVSVNFGLHTSAQFDATLMPESDEQNLTFFRINENVLAVENACLISVNMQKNRVGIVYDCFECFCEIQDTKKVDDNYYFKCATDFCDVEIYICTIKTWKQYGQSIFLA